MKIGFAAMTRAKQLLIASKGGKAAHAKGTAHQFTTEEAKLAGHEGGLKISQNREHMAEIGRRGGKAKSTNAAGDPSKHSGDKLHRALCAARGVDRLNE